MKLVIIAGPPSAGKTSLAKQIVKRFKDELTIAFLKIDVVKAFEDLELKKEFGILTLQRNLWTKTISCSKIDLRVR